MKVTMKTHEQLLASGWRLDEEGYSNSEGWLVTKEMFDILGEEIIVKDTMFGWGFTINDGSVTITPAMVVSKEEKVLEILRNYENHKTRTTPKDRGNH